MVVATRKDLARLPDGGRFIALDSLRGIAAIGVVLFHMGPLGWIASLPFLRNGWLMVDFFFVLSGFVIAASYGERLARGFPRGRFMLLRLGRVVPLHVAAVLLLSAFELIYVRGVLGERHGLFYFWRGLLLLDGFATRAYNVYAPVSWSISVEIVLYAAAALAFGTGRRGVAFVAAAVALCFAALAFEWNYPVFGRLLQRGVIGFGIGVACHALHRRWHPQVGRWWLTMLEGLSLATVVWLLGAMPLGGRTMLLTSPIFAVVVLVFARDRGWVSRLLHIRPMVWLGTLSYSIYMLHMLLLRPLDRAGPALMRAIGRPDLIADPPGSSGIATLDLGAGGATVLSLVLIGLVLAMSAVSFRWLEEPARLWSRDHARRWGAGAAEREALTI